MTGLCKYLLLIPLVIYSKVRFKKKNYDMLRFEKFIANYLAMSAIYLYTDYQ